MLQEGDKKCKLEESQDEVVNLPSVGLQDGCDHHTAHHNTPLPQREEGEVGVWEGWRFIIADQPSH